MDAVLQFWIQGGSQSRPVQRESRDANLIDSPTARGDMNSAVLTAISIFAALFLGFTVSFVVTPDPTGILPVVVGVVLTGVLTPAFYFGSQRLFDPNERST
jgi:hypothetical protein